MEVEETAYKDALDAHHDRLYLAAMCKEPHADGSLCLPAWDGVDYVCIHKLDKEIHQRIDPLGVIREDRN